MKKRILAGILSAALLVSNFTSAFAETVSISIAEKPNIDILLTTGDFTSDLSNIEQDIRTGLENDGIDTSNISFQTIETSVASSDSMDATQIFNEWGRIGYTGQWSLTTVDKIKTIQNAENTDNYTGFYYNDSFDYDNEILEFDNRSTNSDDDFMGAMIRFNINTDSTDPKKKTCTTYIFALDKHDNGGGISNGSFNGLLKITNKPFAHANVEKLQTIPKVTWTRNTWAHYKIVAKGNNIKVYQNDNLIIDYTDESATAIESGSYGFFSYSQPYAQYRNFVATCETERDYGEVLTEPTWRSDATHIIINVDKDSNNSLISNPEVLTRTLADDIHFIQWGTEANEQMSNEFITKNDNKGMFTLGAYQQDYDTAVANTINYIESILEHHAETQYVIIGRDTNLEVTPEKLKTNAVDVEHPDGRWIVHHDYTYFDNNLGQSMQTENYTPNLTLNFDKPGAYNIYFDDNLVKTVYAHRMPVVDFTMSINSNHLTLVSNSYDEDSNIDNGYGKGIKNETWYYKTSDAQVWTKGKLETLEPNNVYIIKLEVEDFQDTVTYTTKYVGTGNPVSYFLTDKSQFSKYYNLNITDASYDPVGYDIVGWEWSLKKGKNIVATYNVKSPTIDFKTIGSGDYSLVLRVKNSQGTWSESYTRGISVLEDTTPPSVTIDPTYCDWKESQNININVDDSDSGLSKWRYCYTQSQAAPNESDWGDWQTETQTTLVFDTDGEYYLHFEAYDNANNKLERTVGSYKITHPYTNTVTHHFGIFDKKEFKTYDWGKWYSPVSEFKLNVNGFKPKDSHLYNYPTAGMQLETSTRIKQPSTSIDFDFYYEPEVYNVTYNYNLDDVDEVNNQNTYTVLNGFKLNNPSKEGYTFLGWYLNGESINSINFNKSNEFDSFEEFKSEMDNRISGNITLEARWRQENFEEGTNVFATIVSDYKVTIPKTIVLSGENKEASYYVKAEGDIAGIEIIKIVPDDVVYLKSINKDTQTGIITQEKISWEYNDLGTTANGNIKANGITAGKWSGHFNFNITLENDEQNVNSEENVIYKTFHYPGGEITDLE